MPIDYTGQQKYNFEQDGNSVDPIITRKKKMELMEVYKDNNSRDSIHLSKFNNKIYNEKGIEASNKEQTFSFMDSLRGGGESTKNRGGDNSI